MSVQQISVVQPILAGNDAIAAHNRCRLQQAGVLAINIMAAPGSGKTSLIIKTIAQLKGRARIGVIEGDIAGAIDTEKVLAAGADQAYQINTGGGCHLEAAMVRQALDHFKLEALDLLFVENVGNLVCPTQWALGEAIKLCVLSTAEGHDKPIKYPELFRVSDVIVLNKIDLIEVVDFERASFYAAVQALNPRAPIFEVSCRNGEGLTTWTEWLLAQR
ncbi:MAG: hydrogenase nickel incorporation protein HypB [Caldilineaceae bacterium]